MGEKNTDHIYLHFLKNIVWSAHTIFFAMQRKRKRWEMICAAVANQYDSNGSSCLVLLHDTQAFIWIFWMPETEISTLRLRATFLLDLIRKIRLTYPYWFVLLAHYVSQAYVFMVILNSPSTVKVTYFVLYYST
jgi:hypothetical protein